MSHDSPDKVDSERERPQSPSAADRPDGVPHESGGDPALVAGWAEVPPESEGAILRELGTGAPRAEVLDGLCALVEAISPGASCAIFLRSPEGPRLRLASAGSLAPAIREAIASLPIGAEGGPFGRSAAEGRVVVIDRPEAEADGPPFVSTLSATGFRACVAVPIRSTARDVVGVVGLLLREPRAPVDAELRACERAAEFSSIALERPPEDPAVRRDQQRLQMALEAGRMGTWEWDIRSGSIWWSDNVEEIHGLPRGSFEGTYEAFRKLVHPDDLPRFDEAIARAIRERSSYELEFRTIRPDGSIDWMLGKGLVFCDERGEPARMMGLGMNLTDRKRAEEKIREGQELFRTLADSIPQLAWMARPDGSIFWYNRRWYDYTGGTPEQLLGWGWTTVHDPNELPRVMETFRAAIASGTPWEDTFPIRRHDGTMRWHLSRAEPVRDAQGRIVRWFGTNTDITERMEMEATLKESDRRKDEFLAMLAHELRNPLAPIATALQLIGRSGVDDATIEEAREVADRQLRHLSRLIDDLMDVARITRGRITLQAAEVDLVEITRRALGVCREALDERKLRLVVTLPERPLPMRGDPTRLEQILWNLLQNAAKYTEVGGRVEVELSREGARAVIRVSDTGVGIPQDQLDRIFDPFTRAEVRYDRARGGLGIGLSLVKTLVELHGGSVEAKSDGPGLGSTFLVRLPVSTDAPSDRPAEVAPPASRPEPVDRPSPPSRRVLIVDDNEDAAAVLARLLQRSYGQQVRVAHDGPSALEAARSFLPEVVLLDIGLPGLDGFEVARILRARPETKQALIVALTGWGQERDRQRSRDAGFDHHLVKPAPIDQIVHLILESPR